MSSLSPIIFQKYTQRDIEVLKEYCQQRYLSGGIKQDGYVTEIPTLDHSIYPEELLFKQNVEQFPHFYQLDQKIARNERIWTVNKAQKEGTFIIKPIDNFKELESFKEIDSPFCFFHKNIAQLYLYTAHQFTRLLGVLSFQDGTEKPEGVLPFLLLRDENRHPWLYLEAAMLTEEILKTPIHTTLNHEIPFAEAVLDIIAIYTAIQKENIFPVIGSTQKDRASYGSNLKAFLDPAVRQFSSHSYTNLLELIDSPEKGKTLMKARYEGQVRLELPEDEQLNAFLKAEGHPLPYLFSYAFLRDQKRQIYINNGKPTGWGEMKGETEFVPLLSYIPIFNEKCKQQMVNS